MWPCTSCGGGGAIWPVYALAVLVVAGSAWLAVRHRRRLGAGRLGLLLVLAYLILAFTALYVLGRSPDWGILEAGAAFRYTWVQRLLLIGALGILSLGILPTEPGPARRGRSSRRPTWRTALVWGLFTWLTVLNLLNNHSYRSPRRHGHQVAAFVLEVAAQEEGASGVSARLPRGGPWSIELGKAPEAGSEGER